MSIKSFMFGGNAEAKTPQELARQRSMIDSMSPNFGSANNVGEGIGHALTGLAMGIRSRQANKAQSAGRKSGTAAYDKILSNAFGPKSNAKPPSTIEAKSPKLGKDKVLGAMNGDNKRVEVASLDPNAGQPSTAGGNMTFSHPEQAAGLKPNIKNIVAGANNEAGRDTHVNSGYRNPAYNKKVGGAKNSKHMAGTAIDESMAGMTDQQRQSHVQNLVQRGAGAVITYDKYPDMLHVDDRARTSEFEPKFMHNASSRNMGNAPEWMQELSASGGVMVPNGQNNPIPMPETRQGAALQQFDQRQAIAQAPQTAPKRAPVEMQQAQSNVNPNTREILARTMQAEAGGEGLSGMIDVGSVIQNRAASGKYGDGIEGVIMKDGQFSAWNGLTGYNGGKGGLDMANLEVSEAAYQAADAILSGQAQDGTGGATHYYNNSQVDPKWGQNRAGGEWQQRGAHLFGNAGGQPAQQQRTEVANLGGGHQMGVQQPVPSPMGVQRPNGVPLPVAQPVPQADPWAGQRAQQAQQQPQPHNVPEQVQNPMQAENQPQQMAQQQGAVNIRDLIEASQNPWMTDGQRDVVKMLLDREMQNIDPMRALEMKKMQQELLTGAPDYQSPTDKLARDKFSYDQQQDTRTAGEPIEVGGVLVDPKTYQPVYKPDQEAPTSVQEYQFYAEQMIKIGQKPLDPLAYKQALKGNGMSLSVGADGEISFNQGGAQQAGRDVKTMGKELSKSDRKMLDNAREASTSAETLDSLATQLETVSQNVGYTGVGGELYGAIDDAVGFLDGDSGARGAFRSLAMEAQLTFTEKTKGAITDREMGMFKQAVPNLSQTPDGNQEIIKVIRAGAKRTQARASFFEDYLSAHGSLQGGQNAWQYYINENPLISAGEDSRFVLNPIVDYAPYVTGTPEKKPTPEPKVKIGQEWQQMGPDVKIRKKQ